MKIGKSYNYILGSGRDPETDARRLLSVYKLISFTLF